MITSTKNEWVQRTRALLEGRARRQQQRFLIEGSKLLEEALAAGLDPSWALVTPEWEKRQEGLAHALRQRAEEVLPADARVIAAATGLKAPQGVAAVFPLPGTKLDVGKDQGLFVALEGIQDPGNMGTLLRTAEALGATGALLSEDAADPFSLRCLRGGMGAVFRLPVLRCNLMEKLDALGQRGFALVGADMEAPDFFARSPLPANIVLVIGSEGSGLGAGIRSLLTHTFSLPMPGGAESLNASVAAGVMLYDLWRSRS